jgi:short-subunit dehydrogenase
MSAQTAIVTGASSGLGAAISALLRDRSLDVVGVSRRGPDIKGDASQRGTAKAAVAEAARRGTLSILVNCAGAGIFKSVGSYTFDDLARVFTSNLASTINFCEVVFPLFKESGGTIVNVMSSAALIGKAGESVYCAAKWGVRGYTEALRAEGKGSKVRILAAYPGGMKTAFWKDDPRDTSGFMDPADVAAAIVEAIFQPPGIQITDLTIARGLA